MDSREVKLYFVNRQFKPVRGTRFAESSTYAFFKEVFLPQGFPESVHKDYVPYQIWDTLQAFASTINGTLTTHSIMRGVGVGESTATPLAAAITWILKDGTGMIGRILFAWWQGNNLGSQCKKWRLFADILNDVAMTIEVMVPYISTLSSYTLCLTTGMKAIVGIAGGSTRTAIMQHHAINDNMADVSAKEHSQGTLVNLAGSAVGILILLLVHERIFIYLCLLLVIAHILFNYFAVTSLKIETLNEDRLYAVIEDYILYHKISTVTDINDRECVLIFLEKPAKKIFGFDIECGASFEHVLKMHLIQAKDTRLLLTMFLRRKYLPVMDVKNRKIYIILSKDASDTDILKAYFHSCIYAIITCQMTGICSDVLNNKKWSGPSYPIMRIFMFPKRFSRILSQNDSYVSAEYVLAVDQVVFEECHIFIKLLEESGWTVKINMLPIKSWRGGWK
ncbi:RUS family member 1 isoform X2 [Phymastichus coffea]|uniref:RUS family member 1 isoform X2 n=1 Tax=Phymastichus coffea TaxID=108790 RepID=UPI00273BBA6E|nr:RUS family member 1 isoform X2 [Phymastichus coffea]